MRGTSQSCLAFGVFQVDFRSGELRKNGVRIKLQEKPFRILELLLEHPGEVVSREKLREKLWRADTFVDFDHSLGTGIGKLRQALGDSAQNPRFVETLAGRGYRFIAPVSEIPSNGAAGALHVGASEKPVFAQAETVGTHSRRLALELFAGALLVVALLAWLLRSGAEPRVLRTVQLTHNGRVEIGGNGNLITDGPRIYFVERTGGRWSLAQASAAGGESEEYPTSFPNLALLDISPDRSALLTASFAGLSDARPLWVMSTIGGPPRRLGELTSSLHAAWSPDGQKILYSRDSDLYIANGDGTEGRKLAHTTGTPMRPRWSPDGRMLRFTLEDSRESFSLWEVSADGRNLHPLLSRHASVGSGEGESDGNWLANGKYFVFRAHSQAPSGGFANGLWVIRQKSGLFHKATGRPVLLYTSPMELEIPVPSVDGKRVFVIGRQDRRELVRYDSDSHQFVPYLGGASAVSPSFSPDGQQVAYVTFPDRVLWRSRADGSHRVQLTFPPMLAFYPQWSPDGTRIAFMAQQPGKPGKVAVISADGSKPKLPAPDEFAQDNPNWSPEGRALLFRGCKLPAANGDCTPQLLILDLESAHLSVLPSSDGMGDPAWSPDGRYVVAHTQDQRSLMLYDCQSQSWLELAKGASFGRSFWSRDSRQVYFQDFYGGVAQPIFRAVIGKHKIQPLVLAEPVLPADVTSYSLTGLTHESVPLATLNRTNSDVYALDVDLP